MEKPKELSTIRKVLLTLVALYVLGGFLEGHAGFASVVGIVLYFVIILMTSKTDCIASEEVEWVEEDEYKEKPLIFYQTSSSDNTIWTDYDEHIHR